MVANVGMIGILAKVQRTVYYDFDSHEIGLKIQGKHLTHVSLLTDQCYLYMSPKNHIKYIPSHTNIEIFANN
jgi:hypothetical protein